jgi:hypothetical protein
MLDPRIQDRSGVQFEPRAWGYLFNPAHIMRIIWAVNLTAERHNRLGLGGSLGGGRRISGHSMLCPYGRIGEALKFSVRCEAAAMRRIPKHRNMPG